MINHIPHLYYVSIIGSFLIVAWTYYKTTEKSNKNKQNTIKTSETENNYTNTDDDATKMSKDISSNMDLTPGILNNTPGFNLFFSYKVDWITGFIHL